MGKGQTRIMITKLKKQGQKVLKHKNDSFILIITRLKKYKVG